MAVEDQVVSGGTLAGSSLTRKVGPLPIWAWMAVVLLVLLGWSLWRRNQATATAATTAGTATDPSQTPPYVIQNYIYGTEDTAPPVGGRQQPPPVPGSAPPPGGPGVPTPNPTPGPPSPVPVPAGQWVTVAKWSATNPPWSSTLWGIADHIYGSGSRWSAIWDNPANASLKARRKDPKAIQPGDRVYVPAK